MPYGPSMSGLTGVREQGKCKGGSPRNLGGLAASMPLEPFGNRRINPRPVGRNALRPTGAKRRVIGGKWYHRAKETKQGETGSKKS